MLKVLFSLVFLASFFIFPLSISAQAELVTAEPHYSTGQVIEVLEQQEFTYDAEIFYVQKLLVRSRDGVESEVVMGSEFQPLSGTQLLAKGDNIVVAEQIMPEGDSEQVVADTYRLPILAWLLAGFFLIVMSVAGFKGLFSIGGMFLSLMVLSSYVVPQILNGAQPVVVALIGAVMIAGITIYLSHGFKASSHIALASILSTLLGVTLLSAWYLDLAHLTGFGSEEAAFLQVGATAKINLQGLLLSGIMLGALGVLDDIAIAQVATVFELRRANKKLSFQDLYQRGMRVGKDHVASLVNTLVLAYAGANLPIFLLFTLSADTPLWVILNNQLIAEEVVRTLMGSIGLVAAVPLSTAFAAYWASGREVVTAETTHKHQH